MLGDFFSQFFGLLIGSFVSIPTDNALGVIFVVLNGILLILATILGLVSGNGISLLGG